MTYCPRIDLKIIGLSSLAFKFPTADTDSNKSGPIKKCRWRALYSYIVIFLLYLLINYTVDVRRIYF
jgi:hypothetical protein